MTATHLQRTWCYACHMRVELVEATRTLEENLGTDSSRDISIIKPKGTLALLCLQRLPSENTTLHICNRKLWTRERKMFLFAEYLVLRAASWLKIHKSSALKILRQSYFQTLFIFSWPDSENQPVKFHSPAYAVLRASASPAAPWTLRYHRLQFRTKNSSQN